MAGGEHEPEQVVAERVVGRGLERSHGHGLGDREFTAELLVLAVQDRPSPEKVDGPMLGRAHQPRAGIFGDAFFAPEFERMKAAGVTIVQPIAERRDGVKSFFVAGPDAVSIEIVEDKPIPDGLWR